MARNLAREAALEATFPDRITARLTQLRTQLPDKDRALIGRHTIVGYLVELGVLRRNKHPISYRMLLRWKRTHFFPLYVGAFIPTKQRRVPPMTTTHAVTAWVLEHASIPNLFHLQLPENPRPLASFTTTPSGRAPAIEIAQLQGTTAPLVQPHTTRKPA